MRLRPCTGSWATKRWLLAILTAPQATTSPPVGARFIQLRRRDKAADTLSSVGNTERAERAYRKAISLDPTRTEAYDSVIKLMIARGADDAEMVDMLKLAYQNTANAQYNTLLLTYGPSTVRFDPEEGTLTMR